MDNVVELPKEVCEVCKKRPATKVCDMPKGNYCGMPPHCKTCKHKYRNEYGIEQCLNDVCASKASLIMCDTLLCDECAITINGIDLCPDCAKKLRDGLIPIKGL